MNDKHVLAVMDDIPELLLLATFEPGHARLIGIAPKVREARDAISELLAAVRLTLATGRIAGTLEAALSRATGEGEGHD